jgi:hypothetical protein
MSADVKFAEVASLASGSDSSSDTFSGWFKWQRIFVVTTWAHLLVAAIMIVMFLVPRLLKTLWKLISLLRGSPTAVGGLPPAETLLTYTDAMAAGKFKARCCCGAHVLLSCAVGAALILPAC